MTPSADRVQCPHCLARVRIKQGTWEMYAHNWGRPGLLKQCPGSGKSKRQAKAEKAGGAPVAVDQGPRPEDIF